MELNIKEDNEIVGIMINKKIYTGIEAIIAVKLFGDYDELISRARAKFMNCADLGYLWDKLASAPAIMNIDGENITPGNDFKHLWRNVNNGKNRI
jgi:hypothetical protein